MLLRKKESYYYVKKWKWLKVSATDSIVMLGEANGANYASGVGAVVKLYLKLKRIMSVFQN